SLLCFARLVAFGVCASQFVCFARLVAFGVCASQFVLRKFGSLLCFARLVAFGVCASQFVLRSLCFARLEVCCASDISQNL
ncbi:MAG: hypothetical protein ACOYOA_13630, partial [Saprospiraceae bacterium]